ncbi:MULTISPECIES: alpha/beta hydrolase [unclassified Streptomyces]|uniref:alpha/beta hydrolase n=1 Tax=unclassified Streptomyces TaxID=2593676 RepID=UPI00225C38FE|nr:MULTISPECIES: alpha/beta hydrolase [unclassified Streptomyces]MCX4786415.1 alpha/beta hydrolase [Streptomyces sp. NBC_01221]MCX4797731.1 alpha/beta hydrolase [Streptomyces sp. NBC_01242]WSP59985.1 alpha/beta hydrolase [Streptomyces sp. NBC_01241]WSP67528.1 alpha/beta hydrolase [Streptomyces sp. NBC_01240]
MAMDNTNRTDSTTWEARKRRRTARRRVTAAAVVVLAALGTAPVAAQQPADATGVSSRSAEAHGRGTLLDITPVADLDRADVARFLVSGGMDTDTVRHGLRAYRLTYRTITPQGAPTTATGLLALPKGGPHRLDLVSDTHGTMAHRDYAPSVGEDFGRFAPYLHASAGRAVAAPDYLGLGKGPGRHPYMDTKSSVTASVDMLRASRTAALRLDRPLTGDVYASGFSQGGQVAMALGRALDNGVDRHFRLRALAPVSGPYDIEHAEMPALFDGRVNDISGIFYMSYFLTAQNRLHPLYKDPSEAFREPYAGIVDDLFDTNHTEEQIIPALPATLKELLTDDYYRQVQHPTGALLAAVRAQDGTCAWKPDVPVRLYSSSGDADVPIANARDCASDLAAHGVAAPVVDQGSTDHNATYMKSGPQIVRWFDAVAARS